MTERHAFLTAIRENPDDDTPRLVYADWLEEHGEPERAELIRVQMELEKPPPRGLKPSQPNLIGAETREFHRWGKRSNWGKRQGRLRRRELEIISPGRVLGIPPGWGWTTIPERAIGTGQPVALVRRGILELVASKWELWRERGDAIWERELPWRVRLTTRPMASAGVLTWGDFPENRPVWIAGQHTDIGRLPGLKKTWLRLSPAQLERRDDFAKAMLEFRWPGIEFELPPVWEEWMGRPPTAEEAEIIQGAMRCPICNGTGMPGGVSGYACPGCSRGPSSVTTLPRG